jgi:hypothetical protein
LAGPALLPLPSKTKKYTFRKKAFTGTVSRDFFFWFFHELVSPKALIIPLWPINFFRKFTEIFAAQGLPPVSTTSVARQDKIFGVFLKIVRLIKIKKGAKEN